MFQEYLFTNKESKEEIENYNAQQNNITLEIEIIDNSDCWIAKFSTPGNNKNSAKILSK